MLTLATAAHDYHADFYVTAATVIPVYFLVLTIAPGTLHRYVRIAVRMEDYARRDRSWEKGARRYAAVVDGLIGSAFVYGSVAELVAITTLYNEAASPIGGLFVILALVFLTTTTGMTALAVVQDLRRSVEQEVKEQSPEKAPSP